MREKIFVLLIILVTLGTIPNSFAEDREMEVTEFRATRPIPSGTKLAPEMLKKEVIKFPRGEGFNYKITHFLSGVYPTSFAICQIPAGVLISTNWLLSRKLKRSNHTIPCPTNGRMIEIFQYKPTKTIDKLFEELSPGDAIDVYLNSNSIPGLQVARKATFLSESERTSPPKLKFFLAIVSAEEADFMLKKLPNNLDYLLTKTGGEWADNN